MTSEHRQAATQALVNELKAKATIIEESSPPDSTHTEHESN
jgi:hypothetical protein